MRRRTAIGVMVFAFSSGLALALLLLVYAGSNARVSEMKTVVEPEPETSEPEILTTEVQPVSEQPEPFTGELGGPVEYKGPLIDADELSAERATQLIETHTEVLAERRATAAGPKE